MTDLVIIGGGPAGMSAAVSAYESGIRDILILERDESLGGILQQCIHNGFGLHNLLFMFIIISSPFIICLIYLFRKQKSRHYHKR